MASFVDELDPETLEAGKRFIRGVKSGVYRKRTLPNTSKEYPLDKAAKSFDHFITTDESKNISNVD